jgi:hypothetical protein
MMHSVCPPNNFNGISYDFYSFCSSVVTAWSGGLADTKRNRLIVWGGGHSDYQGNEIYALNLGTSPQTITRITDPSAWDYSISYESDPDGAPTARHTYNDLVYLPVQDALFSFSGGRPSGTTTNHTWMFTFADSKWHAMDPVNGFNPLSIANSPFAAACAYDSNTQTVFCIDGGTNYLLQYNPATNTYSNLSINAMYPYAATPAIDPIRKLMVFMGTDGTNYKVAAIDISGADPNYTVQDWTSQVTGCAGMGVNWPGFVYDSALGQFVGYPNQGGTVYVFDAGTKTCTAQNYSNAPAASATTAQYGTFGHFQYFPGLNTFALLNDVNQNAYTLTLGALTTSTPPPTASACDLNGDGKVDSTDVQIAINQTIGIASCGNASLTGNGQCTVVSVQRIINASLGGACVVGP